MLARQQIPRFLTDPRGPRFAFDAGSVALDFGYSGGVGVYAKFEILHQPADLQRWLESSDLQVALAVDDDGLAAAKQLRLAVWETLAAASTRRTLPVGAVGRLNTAAAEPPLIPMLTDDGVRWRHPNLPAVLSTLAREAIELATMKDGRLRQCAADDCPLMFYDTSRSGLRRWCSMQRCGNRHKVRSHRDRTDSGPSSG